MKGRVLIVAGSDSGGGAGIQADIKTVTALGAFAATAITALTAQNTEGVHGVVAVEPAFIAQQIEVVLSDIGADALKTGMLHSAEVIDTVASSLKKHAPGVPLVVDPVMVAKGGHRLLLSEAEAALRDTLLPMAALLTPNLPEAEVLAGFPVRVEADMRRAAERLAALGAQAVLMKGGHLEGDRVVDLLFHDGRFERFEDRAHREPQHPRHRLHARLGDRRRPRPEDEPAAMRVGARARRLCARAPSRPRPASAAATARSITP